MIDIKGQQFKVIIIRKPIKNLYLKLEDDTIVASAPLKMAEYKIYNFIETKRNWIYKTYQAIQYNKEASLLYRGGDVFYLFNKSYKLVINIGQKNILIKDDTIYLTYRNNSEDAISYLYKYLDKYLLSKANEILDMYLYLLVDYGYNNRPILNARKMKSKWGVCFTRQNKITINSYLIHYDLRCLQYIILHEICHFIIPNHSKRFYEIIAAKMPDYKDIQSNLR